ncbi:metallophosphoesterase [Nocardia stercoris]|nr:metallophosphoesterase [Nocardia stercoris]
MTGILGRDDAGNEKAGSCMILIAQLSDVHFDTHDRNAERTERVLAYLLQLPHRPDAVLVTGDIADRGRPAEYAQARATFDGPLPLWFLPGNHDDRGHLRAALLDQPPTGTPINQAVELPGVTVALLDSTIPGDSAGLLADETFDWLENLLAATPAENRVVLAMHHPPMPMYHNVCDGIRLANPDRLERIIERDPRILATLTGHLHSAATTLFGGRPFTVAPSVASQIGNSWDGDDPLDFPIDYAPDPSVLLHIVDGSRFTSVMHTVAMGGRIPALPN